MHMNVKPLSLVRMSLIGLVALASASCDTDNRSPLDPNQATAMNASPSEDLPGADGIQGVLAATASNFAGLWYDPVADEFNLALVVGTDHQEEQAAIAGVRSELYSRYPTMGERRFKVRPATYSFQMLSEWRQDARTVFADPRVVGLDVDERANRVVVRVTDLTASTEIGAAVAKLGIPDAAVEVVHSYPAFQQVLLTDKRRPKIENGFSIQFLGSPTTVGVCTLGADASGPGGDGFITNSHCSYNLQVGTGNSGTVMYQNTYSGGNQVATEAIDPVLFQGGPCPVGKYCRYSDALWARYSSSSFSGGKKIAETTVIGSGSTMGSLTVARYRSAPISSNVVVGFTVRKTGQTSGTTQGSVHATCVDQVWGDPAISKIVLLCQDEVNAPSKSGDSGSPVYLGFNYSDPNSTVYHSGVLWGGACPVANPTCLSTRYTLSPWAGIAWDVVGY